MVDGFLILVIVVVCLGLFVVVVGLVIGLGLVVGCVVEFVDLVEGG